MIKEEINLVAEDIEDLVSSSMKLTGCTLEECFPAEANKLIEIDGKKYVVNVEVKLKRYNGR